jgi:DNA-binding CsgD family transcriptional regulator
MVGRPDSWQYAMALSGQSQLDMLADRNDLAIERGTKAMALADRLERTDIYLHAITNVSAARSANDIETGLPMVEAAVGEARGRGGLDQLPRLFSNLTYIMTHGRRYEGLFDYFAAGIAAAFARDNVPLDAYMRGSRATALLDTGRLDEAIAEGEYVLCGPCPPGVGRFPALVALSRARVRRGLPEDGAIDQARALPTASRDLMRLAPIAYADAEACWLGEPRPWARERLRAAGERVLQARSEFWLLAEIRLWRTILGDPQDLPDEVLARFSPAHRLHITGQWREAAAAWREGGCPYEQAIALSTGDEAAQREALVIFERLGAAPAARKLRREMRERGLRSVPSGPRAARRSDPAGLTPRQKQVLELLAQGLSNTDIADRLKTSPKTVEHHVGAVLAAFEATSRLMAVRIAHERGLFAPAEN